MKLSVSLPGYVRKSSSVLRTYQRLQFAPVLSVAMSYIVICLLFSHSYRLLLNEFKVIRHKSVFKCLDNMLLQASSNFSHALCLCVLPFSTYSNFFPCLAYSYSLKMETTYISKTSLHSHQTTHHQTPEGCHLHGHCCVNLKSHMTKMKC